MRQRRSPVLLLCLVAAAAAATAQQQPAQQQARSTSAPAAATPAARPLQLQPPPAGTQQKQSAATAVDEFNRLPCERVRCSSTDVSPVCATGAGVAGCNMPDKGCTYTNGCLARCAYGAKVAYLGECTHKDAMRIVEDRGQGRPAQRDCKCDSRFEPVCASSPLCTIPGGCTYASDCYARCAGAGDKDISKGACKSNRRLLDHQQALMI